jgi:DNA-binding ferritin-like protein
MIEKKEFGTVGSSNQVEYFINTVSESNKTHFNSLYTSLDILLAEVFKMKLAILDEKDKSIFNYKEDFIKVHESIEIIKNTIQTNSDKLAKLEEIVIPVVETVEEVIEQPVVEEVKPVAVDESMKMVLVDFYRQLKNIKRSEGCKAVVLKKTFLHSAGTYKYLNKKWKKVFDEKFTSDSNSI